MAEPDRLCGESEIMEDFRQIIIRNANEGDLKGLAEIEQACFSVPWSEESLRYEVCENEDALILVSQEMDGTLTGYLGVWCIVDEGHILNVAVRPEYRRMQVGTALVTAMLKITERKGIKSHTLEVRKSNEAAISLYKRFGFQEAGIRPHYYEDDGEDAVIMWRIGDPVEPGKETYS